MATHLSDDDFVWLLSRTGRPMSTNEISSRLGTSRQTVAARLSKLATYGKLERSYSSARTYRGNAVRFCYWSASA